MEQQRPEQQTEKGPMDKAKEAMANIYTKAADTVTKGYEKAMGNLESGFDASNDNIEKARERMAHGYDHAEEPISSTTEDGKEMAGRAFEEEELVHPHQPHHVE